MDLNLMAMIDTDSMSLSSIVQWSFLSNKLCDPFFPTPRTDDFHPLPLRYQEEPVQYIIKIGKSQAEDTEKHESRNIDEIA
jgi:hypothetical protein